MTDSVPTRDDDLRRLAAEKLARHLDQGDALLARCEELAAIKRGDRVGPINAAARLLRANAQVAQALAHVALVERRTRSVVERIQQSVPQENELNFKKSQSDDEAFAELEDRVMKGLAERRRRERESPNDPQEDAHLTLEEEEWQARVPPGRGW